MNEFIGDERKWRISRSGFSIRYGWGDDMNMVAKYPGTTSPLDPAQFQEWMDNADLICRLYNATLPPRSTE